MAEPYNEEEELILEEDDDNEKSDELIRLEGLERHGNLTQKSDADRLEELRGSGPEEDDDEDAEDDDTEEDEEE